MEHRFANGWDAAAARAAMLLDAAVANLNTGSFGPSPRAVFDHVTALRRRQAKAPMDFLVRELPPRLWAAREALAAFVGGDPYRLVFTANVTAAINLVAAGLTLDGPGEILLTDHEYGTMHWCWERAAARRGLTLRTFPLPTRAADPAEIVAAFCDALSPRTRLLHFSHVVSATGLVLPAAAICAEARRRGVLIAVDGAHAPGMVPLDLEAVGADFYGANCHKWLLAPIGAGFLYLGRDVVDRLEPLQVSWGYRPDRNRLDERDAYGATPRLWALEFEGTRDVCPWLAVPAAIEFQAGLGFDAIRAYNAELAEAVRERFGRLGLAPATPTHPEMHGFLTAFRLPPGVSAPAWRTALWQRYRVEALIGERPNGLLLRLSTHFYNTLEEIDRAAAAVAALLAELGPTHDGG